MTDLYAETLERAEQYATRKKRVIQDQLGAGYDGIVFSTDCQLAIKALMYESLYLRERNVYLRLFEHKVDEVAGFTVP